MAWRWVLNLTKPKDNLVAVNYLFLKITQFYHFSDLSAPRKIIGCRAPYVCNNWNRKIYYKNTIIYLGKYFDYWAFPHQKIIKYGSKNNSDKTDGTESRCLVKKINMKKKEKFGPKRTHQGANKTFFRFTDAVFFFSRAAILTLVAAHVHWCRRRARCRVFTPACSQLSTLTLILSNRRSYCTPHQIHSHTHNARSLSHTSQEEDGAYTGCWASVSDRNLFGIRTSYCCHLGNVRPQVNPRWRLTTRHRKPSAARLRIFQVQIFADSPWRAWPLLWADRANQHPLRTKRRSYRPDFFQRNRRVISINKNF